ncbi:hypothetical protein [Wenyingzhuangia sp. IMCC45574]
MKLLLTLLFVFSLLGIPVASFKDWLILTLIIHTMWLAIASTKLIKEGQRKYNKLKVFNRVVIGIAMVDTMVVFLSISFLFRVIFASLYLPLFYLSTVCFGFSIIINYVILVRDIVQRDISPNRKTVLILSSFCYPIGVYTLSQKNVPNHTLTSTDL